MHLELIKREPALLIRNGSRRVLIIADLHIGYEQTLIQQENYTSKITERLLQHFESLVSLLSPTEIIILGDLKHTIRIFSKQEFRNVAILLEQLQQDATLTIIRGNHDADLELVVPDDTTIIPSHGVKLHFGRNNIYLLHGHALPTKEILECQHLVMGHIHPTIAISTLQERKAIYRVWVKAGWNPTILNTMSHWFGSDIVEEHQKVPPNILTMKILIVPAFLDLLHGYVLNRSSTKFQRNPIFQHLNLNEAEIIMLDHTYLGRLNQLREAERAKEDI